MFCELVNPQGVGLHVVFRDEKRKMMYKDHFYNISSQGESIRAANFMNKKVEKAILCQQPFPDNYQANSYTVQEMLQKMENAIYTPSFFRDKIFVISDCEKQNWGLLCPAFSPHLPYVFIGRPNEPHRYIYQVTEQGVLIRMPCIHKGHCVPPTTHILTDAEIFAIRQVLNGRGGSLIYE